MLKNFIVYFVMLFIGFGLLYKDNILHILNPDKFEKKELVGNSWGMQGNVLVENNIYNFFQFYIYNKQKACDLCEQFSL